MQVLDKMFKSSRVYSSFRMLNALYTYMLVLAVCENLSSSQARGGELAGLRCTQGSSGRCAVI